MSNKKYKLRQTLLMPGDSAIILPVGYKVKKDGNMYVGEGGWAFAEHGVENNKFHWEEVVEPERVEVRQLWYECAATNNHREYCFQVSASIPPDKFPAIKQAIESVLNK